MPGSVICVNIVKCFTEYLKFSVQLPVFLIANIFFWSGCTGLNQFYLPALNHHE